MSSAVDIQIVSPPNLDRIESFFQDASYRETIEFSANFNTRLCSERRLRLPFIDPQTGVAQNHSQLFIDKRQRMPGFREGQIYTYPAARWRRSRRQYLNKMYRFPDRPFQALRKDHEALLAESTAAVIGFGTSSPATYVMHDTDLNGPMLEESSSLGAIGGDTSDSKDSQQQVQQLQQHPQQLKEELPKEWFYDDIDGNDMDSLEDPKSPADDEYDYDPRYGIKKRRKRRPGKRASTEGGRRRRSGAYRPRKTANIVDATTEASFSELDATEGVAGATNDLNATPTNTGKGRRPRGTGTRGRRRTKANNAKGCDPPSPGLTFEPPSFETAAAAVGVVSNVSEEHENLRNYTKYL